MIWGYGAASKHSVQRVAQTLIHRVRREEQVKHMQRVETTP